MIETWYAIVSFMLIAYVILDGRNFGVGMLHRIVARTPEERQQVIASLGPLWSWHEVWLVGFGGTLMAIFPRVFSSAFAGYYLALFLILWCLILRGISVEVHDHVNDGLWRSFWDFVFILSSLLLAVLFGVAAGNLIRGVPLDANSNFSLAFFTDFRVRGMVGLLDWYTVSIAVFTLLLLAAHGATYLTLKTDGHVHDRSATSAKLLWVAAAAIFLAVSVESLVVRSDLFVHAFHNPFCNVGVLLFAASICMLILGLSSRRENLAFVASNVLLASIIATGAASMFPVMLHSTLRPEDSLTAYSAAAGNRTLLTAFAWWPIAFVLTISYSVFIARRYTGKVSVENGDQEFD
jgi:cytochrome bd ubiquinol oxidase subunit II